MGKAGNCNPFKTFFALRLLQAKIPTVIHFAVGIFVVARLDKNFSDLSSSRQISDKPCTGYSQTVDNQAVRL